MGFQISDKAKKLFYGLIVVGLVLLVVGFFSQKQFLFPEEVNEHHPNELVVMSNAHGGIDEAAWNGLKDEIKTSFGDNYKVEFRDLLDHTKCTHAPGEHEAHDGGAHESETDSEKTHAAEHDDGPSFRTRIIVTKLATGGSEEHAHDGGAEHNHAEHDHGAGADHSEAAHASGHGHDLSPAETLHAKFTSGEFSLPDSGFRRFWSNLLVNGFFFFGIALGAIFYLALHYATESGWGVVLLRVMEGIASAMPMGMVVLAVVFLAGSLGFHHIYSWMDPEAIRESGDWLGYAKLAYLNTPFFYIRIICYFSVFLYFTNWFKKTSRREDEEGGVELHYLMYRRSALFLIFFAVFSSTMSWDIIMSIDLHWFSTLFGWYTFSGIWLSAMITIMMITLYLKGKGALEDVNENHIHDVGKWMFALSFLWSYLWFSQFMLTWYSNIPEEVIYFIYRFESYSGVFLGMFAINFILPMVFFMSRDTKRSWPYLIVIGMIIFIGHWFDVFCMVMPGTLFEEWEFGLLEIGMFLMFFGGFLLLVFRGLSKAPLVQKNHPFLQESIHHEF
ncbi:MAG: hypothetical protein ACI9N1_001799 [Flavobacteriales bacterium]|jgi:hypothetical protein